LIVDLAAQRGDQRRASCALATQFSKQGDAE
jgi:hypothetical protein